MENNQFKIMIVEDDEVICQSLKNHLSGWGYQTKNIIDFQNVENEILKYMPQLIILDIGLPFFNGFYWCQKIREQSKIPIVFLSSTSDNMNIVMAMNMGGDDFIAKPFDITVLLAKINAILRRTYAFSSKTELLIYEDIFLDTTKISLSYRNKKLDLTKNEFLILQILFEQKEKIVTREQMMNRLWATDNFIDENTLTVNMNRLRKKLETIQIVNVIKTKKGIGYILSKE